MGGKPQACSWVELGCSWLTLPGTWGRPPQAPTASKGCSVEKLGARTSPAMTAVATKGRGVWARGGVGTRREALCIFNREAGAMVDRAGARRPGSIYEKFLKASRSKAVSSRRCSSVRWVFLLPVAGAAAGSRPAYLGGQSSEARPPGPGPPAPCPTQAAPTTRAWRG